MRTTISLSDEMLRRAKMHAAETGRTLSEVVEEALRRDLDDRPEQSARPSTFLPLSSTIGGLQPGVRLEPKHEL